MIFLIAYTCSATDAIKIKTDSPEKQVVEFAYRVPSGYDSKSAHEYKIMVLFGGRNWLGGQALKNYDFNDFADKHKLFLISPSFKDEDYWEPEKWSGKALFAAISELEKKHGLKGCRLYFYGYSAGGQCSNLFYAYAPERVDAWVAHACGVYFNANKLKNGVPALITCCYDDKERIEISKTFAYRYRESGGQLTLKFYQGEHELNPDALRLAKAFFSAVISGKKAEFIGEDDTMRIFPATESEKVEIEFRNPLFNKEIAELWKSKQ